MKQPPLTPEQLEAVAECEAQLRERILALLATYEGQRITPMLKSDLLARLGLIMNEMRGLRFGLPLQIRTATVHDPLTQRMLITVDIG